MKKIESSKSGRSLQITVPYEKCIKNCPFCIVGTPTLYKRESDDIYYNNLKETLTTGTYNTVVITGDCEPMQRIDWIIKTAKTVKEVNPNIRVEIQSSIHDVILLKKLFSNSSNIDVYAISIYTNQHIQSVFTNLMMLSAYNFLDDVFDEYYKIPIIRLTAVLNDLIDPLKIFEIKIPFVKQVTFKNMMTGNDAKKNEWINFHQFKDYNQIDAIFSMAENVSVVHDVNCMDNGMRYDIFREDGIVYPTW